ncbi:hypothetical protein PAEPH01_1011 [Pancytospora epiphaga]|nr:hypothetical protein PAEPH01_1011 [Pancytospora epiphaga]
MRVAYEGEVIETSQEIEYDYLEIKYVNTNYMPRKKYIIVPITYPSVEKCPEMARVGSYKITASECQQNVTCESCCQCIASLEPHSCDKMPYLSEESNDSNRNIFYKYNDRSERILLINYFKTEKFLVKEGILGYEEFSDFNVSQDIIVKSESYLIKKPFHIKEGQCGFYKTLIIYKFIEFDVKLSVDNGIIIHKENTYKIYGKPIKYLLTGKNFLYSFSSNVG